MKVKNWEAKIAEVPSKTNKMEKIFSVFLYQQSRDKQVLQSTSECKKFLEATTKKYLTDSPKSTVHKWEAIENPNAILLL